MKKCVYTLLWCAISVLLVAACSGDDKEETVLPNSVQMVSSQPENGATNLAPGNLSIVINYSANVFVASTAVSEVLLSGATVSAVTASSTQVTIAVSGLEKSKTYQLIVPEGVVLGPAKVKAQEARISFSTVADQGVDTKLVTANALPASQKVFDYLLANYGKKIVSGAMADVAWNVGQAERVYTLTGKYPAMAFFDYIHLWASPANWIDYGDTKVVEDWWNKGGLVGASWHWNVPKSETAASSDVTYDPTQTTFTVTRALTEGTWENKVMKADLTKMADYLKLLQAKGIPMIWRPLHEAAGNIYEYTNGKAWFWWGADGAEAYKKLWIYLFDFFAAQGINNLIWVWTSQVKDMPFYPGDEYVDIVARDLYGKNSTESFADYKALNTLFGNKMLCLGECGAYIDANAKLDHITNIWNGGSQWSYFMPWYDNEGAKMLHADDDWWTNAMSSDVVVTRDQLPSFK